MFKNFNQSASQLHLAALIAYCRAGHGMVVPSACSWILGKHSRHNLLGVPLESCQLQIPQVISCCILSPLSHISMLKPSSHLCWIQLKTPTCMAAGFILNHQINCMCGCWIRLIPQVINCMTVCVMAAGSS